MLVSSDEYKVIPVRWAWAAYSIGLVILLCLYFFAPSELISNIPPMSAFLFLIVLLLIQGACSIRYAMNVIRLRQSPPPGAWVLSNWRVYNGRTAYIAGWVLLSIGLFSLLASIGGAWLFVLHYNLWH